MALSKEIYRLLEDIVGTNNITEEPAILDSYSFQWLNELHLSNQSKWMPRAEAILLPGSTEDVQAIVRTCNKYGIKFKAHSTGWGSTSTANVENCILLDLRRMDKILEIDEKNMIAVVEPYAINAQVQAEAMKVGLNVHMIGAGASCSPIATCTSFGGPGADSIYMGHSSQVLLAVEWVLPTGDVLRTGSWGSGTGVFCGEGPGPSLRGLFRGDFGAMGGLGVFTKCAIKLSPWPGPPSMSIEGKTPCYRSPLPDNFKAHTIAFPTWAAYADAYYKIVNAEIAYIAHRQFNQWGVELWPAIIRLYTDQTRQLDDLEEILEEPEIKKMIEEGQRSFQIILAGNSQPDINYKEKVLEQILNDTGGKIIDEMERDAEKDLSLLWLIKLSFKASNFIFGGGYVTSFHPHGTPDYITMTSEPAIEIKRPFMGKSIVDDGGDSFMAAVASTGGENMCGWELFGLYDPADSKSVNGINEYVDKSTEFSVGKGWGPGIARYLAARDLSKEERMAMFAASPDAHLLRLQANIRQILDPNDVGDWGYMYLDETCTKEQ